MPEVETMNKRNRLSLWSEPTAWMGIARAAVVFGAAFGFELTPMQSTAVYGLVEAITTLVNRSLVTPVGQ